MTFNKRPGGYFEPCPGGSKTDFNEEKGGILSKFDCNPGVKASLMMARPGGYCTTFRGFSFYKLKHQFVSRGNQAPFD